MTYSDLCCVGMSDLFYKFWCALILVKHISVLSNTMIMNLQMISILESTTI